MKQEGVSARGSLSKREFHDFSFKGNSPNKTVHGEEIQSSVKIKQDQNEVKEGNKKVNVPELHNQNKVETEKPKVGMRYVDVVKGIGP